MDLIEIIEGSELYSRYISKLPAPLNNEGFDIALIIIIASIIVLPPVFEALMGKAAKDRILKAASAFEKEEMEKDKKAEFEKIKEQEERQESLSALKSIARNEEKKAKVSEGALRMFRIGTRSMEPALCINSVVYARPCTPDELKEGDIAIYRIDRGAGEFIYVIHRLIGKTDDGRFRFKGDNEENEDQPVKPEQIEYLVESQQESEKQL